MNSVLNKQLRRQLIELMLESKGKEFTLGWLMVAYFSGPYPDLDENEEYLNRQIEIYSQKG